MCIGWQLSHIESSLAFAQTLEHVFEHTLQKRRELFLTPFSYFQFFRIVLLLASVSVSTKDLEDCL